MIFVCSRWSDEDSAEVEDSLNGPSVEFTTSNEYDRRKSLQTKFEGVVDYDFKNKLEAMEEEDVCLFICLFFASIYLFYKPFILYYKI